MTSVPDNPGVPDDPTQRRADDLDAPDHRVQRSRIRPPRRRASERLRRRTELLIEAEIARTHDDWSSAQVARAARERFAQMEQRSKRVLEALAEFEPTMSTPPTENILSDAELAAVVAQPPLIALLHEMSRTPGRRGRCMDLSGAAAALVLMAASPGASHANAAFARLTNGHLGTRWALGRPQLPPNLKTGYRQLYTITGRPERGFRGHPIEIFSRAHFQILEAIHDLRGPDGERAHPRFGEVGIVDATRLRAPVEQRALNTPAYLRTLRRADMNMVSIRTYERDGQKDTVIGWILAAIVDQATGVTLVSTVREANAYEPDVLFEELLPGLFRLWPECPMHTLIGDGIYDTGPACRTLVEDYSIQPIITRTTPREKPGPRPGIKVVDGRPYCRCGRMKFLRREGFYLAEHRLNDGLARGQKVDNKNARIRWICPSPSRLCPEVSLYFDTDPRDHTWWPRASDERQGARRRALELYRNEIESAYSNVKHNGIGTKDQRCLWARDAGISCLTRLHLLWQATRRLVHENGDYALFAAEYQRLGLHGAGAIPGEDAIAMQFAMRPAHHQWHWSSPAR
jgi:hypothetical protein